MVISKKGKLVIINPELLSDSEQSYCRSIAIYSGTFDPFHLGHYEVVKKMSVISDEVWIYPNNNSTHKNPISLCHRKNMIAIDIEDINNTFIMCYINDRDFGLPHFLENKIKGIMFYDVIGDDHLERLSLTKIERKLYCFSRNGNSNNIDINPLVSFLDVNTSGICLRYSPLSRPKSQEIKITAG